MAFVFGVTAALASVFTEAVARLVGLRGAYLLTGLRELVDNGTGDTDLAKVESAYKYMQDTMRGSPPPSPLPSATGALLGGPILSNQKCGRPDVQPQTHARADQTDEPSAEDDARPAGGETLGPAQKPARLHFRGIIRRGRHRPGHARCGRAGDDGHHRAQRQPASCRNAAQIILAGTHQERRGRC